jgi:hypothetical protein
MGVLTASYADFRLPLVMACSKWSLAAACALSSVRLCITNKCLFVPCCYHQGKKNEQNQQPSSATSAQPSDL